MAGTGKTFLRLVNGYWKEIVATVTSAGAANAGDVVALDNTGKLDNSVLPTGIGADTQQIVASEAIPAGRLVNVFANAGASNVRNADASTTGKEAHGFVQTAVASGGTATVFFEGTDTGLTGLTPGVQWLDPANPGRTTATPPTVSGGISQQVGIATTATTMNFQWEPPIALA